MGIAMSKVATPMARRGGEWGHPKKIFLRRMVYFRHLRDDGALIDERVNSRDLRLFHDAMSGVFSLLCRVPQQNVDDRSVVERADAPRPKAGLLDEPRIDVFVGANELHDRALGDELEGR